MVKPLRARTLLRHCVCAVALKLHTPIQGHNMTLYIKYHYSELNFDWIMPLFGLRNFGLTFACKFFSQTLRVLLLWNFTHSIRVIKWPCVPSTINLNWILTELCPFLDFFFVKPLRTRSFLTKCVCGCFETIHTYLGS